MFSRHDLLEGLYWYYTNNHEGQGSDGYKKLCRVGRLFRPGMLDNGPCSEEAWEVYRLKHEEARGSGMTQCACCSLEVIGVPGMELCSYCEEAQCDPWAEHAGCSCPEVTEGLL